MALSMFSIDFVYFDPLLNNSDREPIHPIDAISEAWNMTLNEQISGSSTLCVATIDTVQHKLHYSNIGDCGLMVIRHIDSEKAGYMR